MPSKKAVNPAGLSDPTGAYTHGEVSDRGQVLHVSGQIAMSPDGQIIGVGDIEAQALQAFANVQKVAEAAGGSMSDVVKLTIFLVNRDDFPTVSRVRAEFFDDPFPACSTVIVSGLVLEGLLVEIEAVAMLP